MKKVGLLTLLLSTALVSACGHSPLVGGAGMPYGNSPYLSGPTPVGSYNSASAGSSFTGSYGDPSFASDPSYGSAPTDTSGYDSYLPPGTAPSDVLPSALPSASPTPVDRAPDPIPAAQFSQASVSDELHLLTYNVWGLPGPLTESRSERFERLGATFNSYDVVTLQETFSDEIEVLKQSSGFAHHARHDNGNLLRLGSGLYTLSKYPILHTDYQAFDKCTMADCLARKGVLLTRIDHPKIGPIDIYTTHYQAEDGPVPARLRIQTDTPALQALIERNSSTYPVLLTGDFNFTPDSPEYAHFMAQLPVRDLWREKHPGDPGYTAAPENPYKSPAEIAKRLDYIFALTRPGVTITPLEVSVTHREPVDGFVLSDHYGVAAHLRIQGQR
ncbi:MAG: endonuclease/exonuclease/phosphatase family protein [Candidatus Sericytochromatia bacterium]